ncbi:uncharacterized protein LOC123661864 [Melitaea cinxia]|uniref:uncharacterized protein LOC123661864 n=1 Tax=Melitaea cinxia TaxID=113334 RepID=UPI001E2711A1|nr:uncharacterized protein LOC123661864 [Melitaea cinxia]
MNAYKYVYTEKKIESLTETPKKNECVLETAEIWNIARNSLYKVLKDHKENENLSGHTESKHWVDTNIKSKQQSFLEGLTTGLKGPSGKGRRLVVSHVGSEEGFVNGGEMILEAKKRLKDYHKEMNSDEYEKWLKNILPKLKENSVLVIDNAPYHTRKLESLPTSSWRKGQIQEWLKSKNIDFDNKMLKAELIEIARHHKKAHERCVVDEMAAERRVTILRLPPYHCELNPIELVLAQVKGHVAKKQ